MNAISESVSGPHHAWEVQGLLACRCHRSDLGAIDEEDLATARITLLTREELQSLFDSFREAPDPARWLEGLRSESLLKASLHGLRH